MIFLFFYFWPEEPAAPVLTSPADSLRDSRYGPRRGRTQQAGAAPHGLGADAPQEDHYSGLAAPPSEMCRRNHARLEMMPLSSSSSFLGYWFADGPGSLRRHFNLRSSLWPAAPGLS